MTQQEVVVRHLKNALVRTEQQCQKMPEVTLAQQGRKGKMESDIGEIRVLLAQAEEVLQEARQRDEEEHKMRARERSVAELFFVDF